MIPASAAIVFLWLAFISSSNGLPEDLSAPGGPACKDGVDHDKRTIRAFNGNDFDSSMLEFCYPDLNVSFL